MRKISSASPGKTSRKSRRGVCSTGKFRNTSVFMDSLLGVITIYVFIVLPNRLSFFIAVGRASFSVTVVFVNVAGSFYQFSFFFYLPVIIISFAFDAIEF